MHCTQNEKIAQLLTLLEEPIAAYSAAHRTDSHRVAVASHSEDEADAASRGEEDGGDEADAADVKVNTGDWAVEQFFRMTRPRYADGVIAEGKVVSFCDEMVVRYLEKVVVEDDEYVVKLRVGWRLPFNLHADGVDGWGLSLAAFLLFGRSHFVFSKKLWKYSHRCDTIINDYFPAK